MICGYARKLPPLGVVRAHHDLPWIVDQQVPLKADRPLQRVDEILVLVVDGGHATARFKLGVGGVPFLAADVVQEMSPAGHRRSCWSCDRT